MAMPEEARNALLWERYHAYDQRFFARNQDGITRGGVLCLRGTRLTPNEVVLIVDGGEWGDYAYITQEQVDACRRLIQWRSQCANDLIRYSTEPGPLFHVTHKEWNAIEYGEIH